MAAALTFPARSHATLPAPGPGGSDGLNLGPYSYSTGTNCTAPVNPIDVVFYDYGGLDPSSTGARAHGYTLSHLEYNAGWDQEQTIVTQPQSFSDNGYCEQNDGDVADALVFQTRNHARLDDIKSRTWGDTSVGTAHFETIMDCGHVVRKTISGTSGFDMARGTLWDKLGGHHFTFVQYWGNTRPFTQCNGDVAASNGNVRWFDIPNYAYP